MEHARTHIATKQFPSLTACLASLLPGELIFPAACCFDVLAALLNEFELFSLLSVFACVFLDVQAQHLNEEE